MDSLKFAHRASRVTKGYAVLSGPQGAQEGHVISPILRDFPDSFETERLLLRSPMPGDGAAIHSAVVESLGELEPWMPWARQEPTVEGLEEYVRRARVAFLERKDLTLLLFLKGTETLVGNSSLHRIDWSVPRFEIGYWIRTSLTGRGYATEAASGTAAFAFETLGAKRVEIRCASLNRPSARVAQRAGFRLEGELRNAEVDAEGEARNTLVFFMVPEKYEASK